MIRNDFSFGSYKIRSVLDPVSLTVWHYYNGAQQATFDTLVEEFNATVGKEKGIYVEEYSQGSVYDLEQAVQSAIKGEVGADDLPDIFSSYADTAYYAQQEGKLVDLTQYFSEDELSSYVDSYIEEGYFQDDGALYLLPVAKSTEIMMINKTDWEPFAAETGSILISSPGNRPGKLTGISRIKLFKKITPHFSVWDGSWKWSPGRA